MPIPLSRRRFIKNTTAIASLATFSTPNLFSMNMLDPNQNTKSIIGNYGEWAASLLPKTPTLSFRSSKWKNIDTWRKAATKQTSLLLASPQITTTPQVSITKKYEYDGLEIEELSWQLPYGHATEAYLLKPKGANKPLPAILGLHDHGGNKYFGKRKIVKTADNQHPMMPPHQTEYYGGKAWANEIAKRGYVVLVHDGFAFESRRVLYQDVAGLTWGDLKTDGKSDADPENSSNIEKYNAWASEHEHVMSKSLFCAGTTWPGVVLTEDQVALSILSNRPEVDKNRMGCAGLSGGGLRTVYLAGLDPRIKCAVCVGFMSTWQDFLLHKSFTHTWMLYTPLLPQFLDFPEILGLRAPLPTMILNSNQDDLFTLSEMHKADDILKQVFAKAHASDRYITKFYEGPHKFDLAMQNDAFEWFDKWLSS